MECPHCGKKLRHIWFMQYNKQNHNRLDLYELYPDGESMLIQYAENNNPKEPVPTGCSYICPYCRKKLSAEFVKQWLTEGIHTTKPVNTGSKEA